MTQLLLYFWNLLLHVKMCCCFFVCLLPQFTYQWLKAPIKILLTQLPTVDSSLLRFISLSTSYRRTLLINWKAQTWGGNVACSCSHLTLSGGRLHVIKLHYISVRQTPQLGAAHTSLSRMTESKWWRKWCVSLTVHLFCSGVRTLLCVPFITIVRNSNGSPYSYSVTYVPSVSSATYL